MRQLTAAVPKAPTVPKAPKPPKEPKAPKAPKGKGGVKSAAGKGKGALGKFGGAATAARPPDPDLDPWAPSPAPRHLLVTAIFILAEIVMIRRTPSQLAQRLLGDLRDPAQMIWTLRWDGHALLQHAMLRHPLSVFNANIYAPAPHTLAYSNDLLSVAPFYNALYAVTHNWTLSLNLLWLGELGLTMGATYSLTRWLTQRTEAGVFAGLAAGFSGFAFSQAGHPQLQVVGLLPLGLLLLFKLLRWPRMGLAVGLGIVSLAIALAAQYWAALYLVAVLVVLIGWLITARGRVSKRLLAGLAVAGAIGVLAAPTLIPYRDVEHTQAKPALAPASSLRPRDLVRATEGSYLYPGLSAGTTPGTDDGHLFPGFATMALAAVGAVALVLSYRRSRAARPQAPTRHEATRHEATGPEATGPPDETEADRPTKPARPIWSTSPDPSAADGPGGPARPVPRATGLAFTRAGAGAGAGAVTTRRTPPDRRRYLVLLLAVGVAALLLAIGAPHHLPAPWLFFYNYVPGFAEIRVTARLTALTLVAGAVLAGFGLDAIAQKLPRPWLAPVVAAVACVVVLAELAAPLRWSTLPSDPATLAVYHALGHEPPGSVVELPMADPVTQANLWAATEPARMVWSTIDWHRRLNGYSATTPATYHGDAEALATFPSAASEATLQARHVRYIILHVGIQAGQQMFTPGQAGAILAGLPAGTSAQRYGPNYLVDLGRP